MNATVRVHHALPPLSLSFSPLHWLIRLITLPLLLPLALLLLMAIAACYTVGGGCVFVRETHIGRWGRPYTVYRFCCQPANGTVDLVLGALRINLWLRLLNIVRGEMTLVGPASFPQNLDRYYAANVPGYAVRQRVLPGLYTPDHVDAWRAPAI